MKTTILGCVFCAPRQLLAGCTIFRYTILTILDGPAIICLPIFLGECIETRDWRLKKPVTIYSIAKEAGVSPSTVSRVLNKKPDVMPETRERVLKVIASNNFKANVYAQGIVHKSTHTIGVAISYDVEYLFMNQYFTESLEGIVEQARRHDYHILLIYCHDLMEALDAYQEQRIDGILLLGPTVNHKDSAMRLVESAAPMVVVGSIPDCAQGVFVETDDYNGTCAAMDYLFSCGHRQIAYIPTPGAFVSTLKRIKAYRDKMGEQGIPVLPGMIQQTNSSLDPEIVTNILRDVPDVTAIMVGSDYLGVGVLTVLQSKGLRVPEDISVVGFDGVPISAQVTPPLTTVCQHASEKGRVAVDMLVEWMENGNRPSQSVVVEPELLVRSSVKDLKKTAE